jgi:cellulose synthase/poly-beta-1,6-N-acetylglucosamine synthase-like glycosyltransferase
MLLETVFWCSLALIGATYVLYPAVMWMAGRRHLSRDSALPERQDWPTVTLVIAAYNEEAVIGAKIENSLALDYPRDRLEIMVVSDESTDGTDEIVRSYADQGVVLARQPVRRGKSAGLTNAVPQARGDILVFSDANSMYRPDAVKHLVLPFGDETTGYVVGAQTYLTDEASTVSRSETLYWNVELAIKAGESRFSSVVGGDGAIFALRKTLFEPLLDDDISDFVTPLRIVAQGYRGVFQPSAVCTEETAQDYGGEFRRKVRIINQALHGVLRARQALNPLRTGLFAFQLFFHKVVRWFVPYLLVLFFASSLFLAVLGEGWIYTLALAGQLLAYGLAWHFSRTPQRALPLASLCFYFCLANLAALQATLGVMTGRSISTWTPERS